MSNPNFPEGLSCSGPDIDLDFSAKAVVKDLAVNAGEAAWDHRGIIAGLTIGALAILSTAGCSANSENLQKWSPEGLAEDMGPAGELLLSWGRKVGFGIIFGTINGIIATKGRIDNFKNRDQFFAGVGRLEEGLVKLETEYAAGRIEKSALDANKSRIKENIRNIRNEVNPVMAIPHIAREVGQGFIAGAGISILTNMILGNKFEPVEFAVLGYLTIQEGIKALRKDQ